MQKGNTAEQGAEKKPCILITGGSGFLGGRIVRELLEPDSPLTPAEIRVFDIKTYEGVEHERVRFIRGDVTDAGELEQACRGVDIVIHCAAVIDWGVKSREEVLAVNVGGTVNVISACRNLGIQYLVYTSSLDAVFTGRPLVDIDETHPYPETHHTSYCESKKLAEIEVLKANSGQLSTCVLRPCDIYGEADPYHVDPLIEMAKSGIYVRLGDGSSKCQHVYVGNMAHAHILAASALWDGETAIAGEVYFITEGPATNFFKFFDQVVTGAGYGIFPRNLWLPRWLAWTMGGMAELFAWLMRPIHHFHPKFSRFAVIYTCTDFTFSAEKARRDFGFEPKYSVEQALEETCRYYRTR